MATHSRILAWGILWTEEFGRPQSMRSQESDMTEGLSADRVTCVYPFRNLQPEGEVISAL